MARVCGTLAPTPKDGMLVVYCGRHVPASSPGGRHARASVLLAKRPIRDVDAPGVGTTHNRLIDSSSQRRPMVNAMASRVSSVVYSKTP